MTRLIRVELTKEQYILANQLTFQEKIGHIEKFNDEYGETHLYVSDAFIYYNGEEAEILKTIADHENVAGGCFFITYEL